MADLLHPGPAPIPVPLTSFIGRDEEFASVIALLSRPEVRLLTLTGPGGIGKSRLALRASETARRQFADGAAFIPLAPVRDPDQVLSTVADVLGVPGSTRESLLERLRAFLTERELLVVLDNLEHVLETAAPLVTGLLMSSPQLKVLSTSRLRLGISGEQVFPLGPMRRESARELFVARAHAVEPELPLGDEAAPIIDAICDRVDRLPLAIELAAARVNVLPPSALLARLEQRLDLLTGGPRDAPARQRGMRETIDWSYGLLTESGQMLFRRLGAFVGGFTLESAQMVAGEDFDVLAGVSALVTASLVIPAEGIANVPRFTMLETIREYALERLMASGEERSIRRLHATCMATLADHLWDDDSLTTTPPWLERTRPEIDNFRLALGWTLRHDPASAVQLAGGLMDFWLTFVPLAEAREWVNRALQADPGVPVLCRVKALLAAGWIATEQGDFEPAEASLTEAVALCRELDDESLLMHGVMFLGQVAFARGQTERARALFAEVRTRAVESDPPWLPIYAAIATMNLGRATLAAGDLATAQDLLEEALSRHQAGTGPIGVAWGQLNLGQVLLALGQHARALELFRAAAIVFANAGHHGALGSSLEGLAGAVVDGQPDQAARLLGAAAAIRDRADRQRDRLEEVFFLQTRESTRIGLGQAPFAAAWEDGTRRTWEELRATIDAVMIAVAESLDAASPPSESYGLSAREVEVLRLLAEGHSNRAIAERLFLSDRTVENHVRHILTKLDLATRTAAAIWAVRHDLA